MKRITKDELYRNLGDFLKAKGIDLKEGSYAQRIQQGCNFLAEAVNMGQEGVERAKTEIDKQLESMRHLLHKRSPSQPSPPAPGMENRAVKIETSPLEPARKKSSAPKASASKPSASRKRRKPKSRTGPKQK